MFQGWIFWSDWGTKAHIAFGTLDGSHKEMIAYNTDDNKHYLGWPNGLTLDTSGVNEKLYWIDAKLHSIFSCSVDHCLGDIQALTYDHEKIIHPYSITVFEVIITSPRQTLQTHDCYMKSIRTI